jgi:hypothetical protein
LLGALFVFAIHTTPVEEKPETLTEIAMSRFGYGSMVHAVAVAVTFSPKLRISSSSIT